MVNTRQRLEQKLSSLRKSALPSTSPIAVSTAAANQASSTVTTPTTIPTSISNNNLNTIENNQTPQQPQSTYIATGNTILDFYCAVAENGVNFDYTLQFKTQNFITYHLLFIV